LKATVTNPETGSNVEFNTASGFRLQLEIDNLADDRQQLDITYHLKDERGILVCVSSTAFTMEPSYYTKGKLVIETSFPGGIINEGIYTFSKILLVKNRGSVLTEWNDVLTFEVLPVSSGAFGWQGQKEGVIRLTNLPWKINTND